MWHHNVSALDNVPGAEHPSDSMDEESSWCAPCTVVCYRCALHRLARPRVTGVLLLAPAGSACTTRCGEATSRLRRFSLRLAPASPKQTSRWAHSTLSHVCHLLRPL